MYRRQNGNIPNCLPSSLIPGGHHQGGIREKKKAPSSEIQRRVCFRSLILGQSGRGGGGRRGKMRGWGVVAEDLARGNREMMA